MGYRQGHLGLFEKLQYTVTWNSHVYDDQDRPILYSRRESGFKLRKILFIYRSDTATPFEVLRVKAKNVIREAPYYVYESATGQLLGSVMCPFARRDYAIHDPMRHQTARVKDASGSYFLIPKSWQVQVGNGSVATYSPRTKDWSTQITFTCDARDALDPRLIIAVPLLLPDIFGRQRELWDLGR